MQKVTIYGDESIIEAQALIGSFVKEEESIKAATKATLDLAAAKGMELSVAADLISKTLGSSTNALSRYGIAVEGAVGSTERLESMTTAISDVFGGQAAAQADTYTGRVQQMNNALGDLAEDIGVIIVPMITDLAKEMTQLAITWQNILIDWGVMDEMITEPMRDLETQLKAVAKEGGEWEEQVARTKESLADLGERTDDNAERFDTLTKRLKLQEEQLAPLKEEYARLVQMHKNFNSVAPEVLENIHNETKALEENTKAVKDNSDAKDSETDKMRARILARMKKDEDRWDAYESFQQQEMFSDMQLIDVKRNALEQELGIRNEHGNMVANLTQLQQAQLLTITTHFDAKKKALQDQIDDDQAKADAKELKDKALVEQKKVNLISNTVAQYGKALGLNAMQQRNVTIAQATADAIAAANTALKSSPPPWNYVAAAGVLAAGYNNVQQIRQAYAQEHAQFGFSGIVDQPTTFTVGEGGQAEMVNVTPLEGPNLAGPQGAGVTVNLSGNVISSDFVEEELPELIAEAVRKGISFNLA